MKVHADLTAVRQTRWYKYAVRFLFGGLITAAAGIIAMKFGPAIGGLFLSSPAIFPASATLFEKHEIERKARLGLNGKKRAAEAVSVAAAGASIGSIGLAIFALLVWKTLPAHAPWLVLIGATLAWMALSLLLWQIRKHFAHYRRRSQRR
jgi:hypothetical protein